MQLSSGLCSLIPLVMEIPPQNVSGTAARIIFLNCYSFSQMHEIQGVNTHFLMCDALLTLEKALWKAELLESRAGIPALPWWGSPPGWKLQYKQRFFCSAIPSTAFLLGNREAVSHREEKREEKKGDVHVKSV